MKIGIVGSRKRNKREDFKKLVHWLIEFCEELESRDEEIIFVSGGCSEGADHFAEIIAKEWSIPITIHYPDKSKLPPNPQRKDFAIINFARNTLIANDSDLLVALVAPDRKGGTEDTIKKFLKTKPITHLILL